MPRWLIWVWLFISVGWFALNFFLIKPHDFNFWFVACLPFAIGLLYFIGAGLTGGWRNLPSYPPY